MCSKWLDIWIFHSFRGEIFKVVELDGNIQWKCISKRRKVSWEDIWDSPTSWRKGNNTRIRKERLQSAKSWGTNIRIWYPNSWGKKRFCLFNTWSDQLFLNIIAGAENDQSVSIVEFTAAYHDIFQSRDRDKFLIRVGWAENEGGTGKHILVFQWVLFSIYGNNSREWGRGQKWFDVNECFSNFVFWLEWSSREGKLMLHKVPGLWP